MKAIKVFKAAILLAMIPFLLFSGTEKKKTETIYIQTSAQCGECKEKIETSVKSLKGVTDVQMNMADKKVMVTYNPKKVSPDQIRTVISKTGYDADAVTADQKAYESLPKCCQKGGAEMH